MRSGRDGSALPVLCHHPIYSGDPEQPLDGTQVQRVSRALLDHPDKPGDDEVGQARIGQVLEAKVALH